MLPAWSRRITKGRDTFMRSAACWVVSSACAGTRDTAWPAAMLARTPTRRSTAARGTVTVSPSSSPGCGCRDESPVPCGLVPGHLVRSRRHPLRAGLVKGLSGTCHLLNAIIELSEITVPQAGPLPVDLPEQFPVIGGRLSDHIPFDYVR